MQEQSNSNTVNNPTILKLNDFPHIMESESLHGNDDDPEHRENNSQQGDECLCRHCGEIVPHGAVICPKCGSFWSRQQ